MVADEWQQHGIAHQMLRPLIAEAVQAGNTRFRADMLPENTAARHLVAVDAGIAAGGHVRYGQD